LINQECFADAMIDTDCLVYAVCNLCFAVKKTLRHIQISLKEIEGVTDKTVYKVREVTISDINLNSYQEEVYTYMMSLNDYNLILDMP